MTDKNKPFRPMTAEEAFRRLSALCARSEQCSHDATEKMRRWGVSDEEQAAVMERLTRERYIDDSRYARAFVKEKLRFNHWGQRKIEQALWLKRIDREVAEETLGEITADDYVAILRPLWKQKARTIKADTEYERQRKLAAWAVGRGFTFDVIRQAGGADIEEEE